MQAQTDPFAPLDSLPLVVLRSSPPAPLSGDALPVPAGNPAAPEILFEHSGWGIYTDDGDDVKISARGEGNILTHIGCDCDFFNWHMAVYVWNDYRPEGDTCFKCTECEEIMPSDAYWFFCKAYNLVNMV